MATGIYGKESLKRTARRCVLVREPWKYGYNRFQSRGAIHSADYAAAHAGTRRAEEYGSIVM